MVARSGRSQPQNTRRAVWCARQRVPTCNAHQWRKRTVHNGFTTCRGAGLPSLVYGVLQVGQKLPTVRLSVFIHGPQRPDLEKMAADLGLSGRIEFHGYVNQTDLAAQMTNHDVFIQHSLRKEGSPVSIVEAMASGLPAVSTPVGGIADLILDREPALLSKRAIRTRWPKPWSCSSTRRCGVRWVVLPLLERAPTSIPTFKRKRSGGSWSLYNMAWTIRGQPLQPCCERHAEMRPQPGWELGG